MIPTRCRGVARASVVLAAVVLAALPVAAGPALADDQPEPAVVADEPAFHALDNGKLRFGTGAEASVNAVGNLLQPWYLDTAATPPVYRKLTFSNRPLEIQLGVGGAGVTEWNRDGTTQLNPVLTDQIVDTAGFTATSPVGTGVAGHGTLVSTGTLALDGSSLEVRSSYRLQPDDPFVRITTRVTNVGAGSVTNPRVWVGTGDDYVGTSDIPTKQRGTLDATGFTTLTDPADRASALRVFSGESGVLFYSTSPKAHTSVASCCQFANATNQDPATAPIEVTNDGSYALYVRLADLAPGEHEEFTWYYAAGALDELDQIGEQVADEALPPAGPPADPVPTPEGPLPAPRLGTSDATVDGQRVPTTVTRLPSGAGVSVQGEGPDGQPFALRIATDHLGTSAGPGGTDTSVAVRRGGDADLHAEGFHPESLVRVWLLSDPVLLGDLETDANGELDGARVAIPADVSACRHTLQAVGSLPDGQQLAVSLGVWVRPEQAPFADTSLGSVHTPAIACLADLGITRGTAGGTSYDQATSVTRGQAASLLARALGFDTSGTADFVDTAGSGHDGAIAALAEAGLVRGIGDRRFGPRLPLQRGQFASILAAAADLDVSGTTRFPDAVGTRHGGAIGALDDADAISGFTDGTFRPGADVSRGQFASMLVRTFPVLGVDTR